MPKLASWRTITPFSPTTRPVNVFTLDPIFLLLPEESFCLAGVDFFGGTLAAVTTELELFAGDFVVAAFFFEDLDFLVELFLVVALAAAFFFLATDAFFLAVLFLALVFALDFFFDAGRLALVFAPAFFLVFFFFAAIIHQHFQIKKLM
ncbi:hypothetical protein [Kaarinaea lacus]